MCIFCRNMGIDNGLPDCFMNAYYVKSPEMVVHVPRMLFTDLIYAFVQTISFDLKNVMEDYTCFLPIEIKIVIISMRNEYKGKDKMSDKANVTDMYWISP